MTDQFEQKPPTTSFEKPKSKNPGFEPRVKIWGEVTDPRKHNPRNYRYLIYAFDLFATSPQLRAMIQAELSGANKTKESEGDQSTNLFEQPEKLGERVSLSMSIIDQDHTKTWGEGGLIVQTPEKNIVITSPTDAGALGSSKEFLRKQAKDKPLLSGDELLISSIGGIYNEVVAFAKSDTGEAIELKGFFIKVDKQGNPIDTVIAQKMRQHAVRLNLPLVEIPIKDPCEQEKFEVTENSI